MKRIYTLLMALVIGLIPAMAEETTVCLNGLYYLLNSETNTAKVYYDDTTYGQTDRKYPNHVRRKRRGKIHPEEDTASG